MLKCSLYNYEAEKKIRHLIRDTKPDALYILHEINSLSPSIINAAKKEGIRVVHRISDFFMLCPKSDFLREDCICEQCIYGNYKQAIKFKCVKQSLLATLVRVFAMKYYHFTRVFNKVDCYIATCEFTKSKLIEGGVSPNKITCAPTFIDCSNIKPNYANQGYFLYLGRVEQQKGVKYAVQAMKAFKGSTTKLKITGELTQSKECYEINRIIDKYDLHNNIEFVGFKKGEELNDLIRDCIAVVNPAIWYENMPNSVIEAFAYGKPVIASRIGSLQEIIHDGFSGLLFEMKNHEDLADKMKKLANDNEYTVTLGRQARKICEEKYCAEKHMHIVLKALNG